MGLKSIFGKVARGVGMGAKKGWDGFTAFDDVMDRIPFANELIVAIPIVGPALAFAMSKVDIAQEMFPGQGEGGKRREWAVAQLRKDLLANGLDANYVDEIVAVAFLATKGHAAVTEDVDGNPGRKILDAPLSSLGPREPEPKPKPTPRSRRGPKPPSPPPEK